MDKSSYFRQLALLALPVALQMLLQSMLGMADVTMVGGLGEGAVAAVGLASKMQFLLLVLMIGIATAGGSLIAQFTGANNPFESQKTIAVTAIVGVLVSVPQMILFFLAPSWLAWINPDSQIVSVTSQFLIIVAPALLFTQVSVIYEAALRSTGSMSAPLITSSIAVFLNIFFNYLFIFGKCGFEPQGVLGAAWGTLLSRFLQVVMLVGWVYWSKSVFSLPFATFVKSFNVTDLKTFVLFSLPMVVNYGLWGLGNTVYHVLMGYSGVEALAIMGVMVPIESAFFALFMGVASASSVLIGQALGRDDFIEAKTLQQFFLKLVLFLVCVFALSLWGGRGLLLPFFGGMSAGSVELLMNAITVFCFFSVFKVLNLLFILGVLRAGGDNRYCLIVDTLVMWAVGLPVFAFCVWLKLPFLTLYALMALEDVIKIIPFALRVRKGRWLRNLTCGSAGAPM